MIFQGDVRLDCGGPQALATLKGCQIKMQNNGIVYLSQNGKMVAAIKDGNFLEPSTWSASNAAGKLVLQFDYSQPPNGSAPEKITKGDK